MIFSGLNIGNFILCYELTYFRTEFLKLQVWVYTSFMVFTFFCALLSANGTLQTDSTMSCSTPASPSSQKFKFSNVVYYM